MVCDFTSDDMSYDWLNSTGFLADVCVVFFKGPSGNKAAVTPNPLIEEKRRHVYNCDKRTYQDELN